MTSSDTKKGFLICITDLNILAVVHVNDNKPRRTRRCCKTNPLPNTRETKTKPCCVTLYTSPHIKQVQTT